MQHRILPADVYPDHTALRPSPDPVQDRVLGQRLQNEFGHQNGLQRIRHFGLIVDIPFEPDVLNIDVTGK